MVGASCIFLFSNFTFFYLSLLSDVVPPSLARYLWNQVPTEGAPPSLDPGLEAGACAQQLERSMQWTLYKKKLVADVLAKKGEERYRKSGALVCR